MKMVKVPWKKYLFGTWNIIVNGIFIKYLCGANFIVKGLYYFIKYKAPSVKSPHV